MGIGCTTVGATGSLPISLPCKCDNECDSNYCVDGVCCESACTDKCKSCSLPDSRGACTLIPAGLPPTDQKECVATVPSTCGLDGTCDGNGGCSLYARMAPCKAGACEGSGISGQFVCNGAGICEPAAGESCFPYSCDPVTNECASSCSTTADCAIPQGCNKNSCGQSMIGAVCKVASDCLSGFCTDGVCCAEACAAPCMACNLPGMKGLCKPLGAGKPDPEFCAVTSYTECGTTGTCDGNGGCSIYAVNTLCGPPTCAGDTAANLPPTCDGLGTCQDSNLIDCGAHRCANGVCRKDCRSDSDCAPGHPCSFAVGQTLGTCSGAKSKANGEKCTLDSECAGSNGTNGICSPVGPAPAPGSPVDGVCCESACTGPCRTCGLPGSLGKCVNVAPGAADPRRTCTNTGKASCGTDGLCDGTGACEKYAVDTECSAETCRGGAYTPASKCNASGQCVTPASRTCSPYQCSGSKCASTCTSNNESTQCQPPASCVNGGCGPQPIGADCGAGVECASGICAQGVCCNRACKDACMACNLGGSLGICTAVPDGKPDPQNQCKASASTSCGQTGMCKGGSCALWPSGQNCGAANCASSASVTPASTCDGKGACVMPAARSCGTFTCDPAKKSCRTSCTVATQTTDCVGSNTCGSNNSCGLKPPGSTCTATSQCASGLFCTEGVCCNSACADAAGNAGTCVSCKVPGKVGTCSPVAAGGADPRGRCIATNPATGNCGNDGTCNGAGACRPWSTATGCRKASCTGSTLTSAASCDGRGSCAASSTSVCNPFVCSATSPSCLTTCTKDADCTGGLTCLKTTNRCGNTLPAGAPCKVTNDCSSGVCSSEGVCCNTACGSACQSCTLTGKVGTCSPIPNNGGPRDTTTCAASSTNICGNTTRCNGSGGCQVANAGVVCAPPTCAPAVAGTVGGVPMSESLALIPASTCNGSGTCTMPAAVSCGAFQCDASQTPDRCKTGCSSTNTDCNALDPPAGGRNTCVSSICQKKSTGQTCADGTECVSGKCLTNGSTQRICCASACVGQSDVCSTSPTCASNGTGGSGTGGRGTGGAGTGGAGTGGRGTGGGGDGRTRHRWRGHRRRRHRWTRYGRRGHRRRGHRWTRHGRRSNWWARHRRRGHRRRGHRRRGHRWTRHGRRRHRRRGHRRTCHGRGRHRRRGHRWTRHGGSGHGWRGHGRRGHGWRGHGRRGYGWRRNRRTRHRRGGHRRGGHRRGGHRRGGYGW